MFTYWGGQVVVTESALLFCSSVEAAVHKFAEVRSFSSSFSSFSVDLSLWLFCLFYFCVADQACECISASLWISCCFPVDFPVF